MMAKRSTIPFGPQHPVLPEPIHLDLVLEDEVVVEAIPNIGFVHRGLEKLVETRDFKQYVYVAERVCGICSFGHGLGYCQSIEQMMVFMQSWRLREQVLDLFDLTTGGRIIFSVNQIGGVLKDMDEDMLSAIKRTMTEMEKELHPIARTFLEDASVNARLRGLGHLDKEQAILAGAVGPMLRASGVDYDSREIGYAAYDELNFGAITAVEGDSYARVKVRIAELFQSFDLIAQILAKMPQGEISVPVKGFPKGESFIRIEQPRGEAIYYTKGNGTKFLDRFRLRTPTTSNIPPMLDLLKGCQLGDVALLILTIDPCISCTER